MGFFDTAHEQQRQYYQNVNAYLTSQCPPGEPLVGSIVTSHAKTFGIQLYAVGVTPNLLILQKVSKQQTPDGPPLYLQRGDIVKCAIWGHGGGFREWMANNSEYELRFQTATEKYKLAAMGGWTMSKLMGDDYMRGLDAVAAWLASCQRR